MGLLKVIFTIVGVVLLALVGLAAYLWFTDYDAQATITDKGQDENGPFVVITPKLLSYDVKKTLTSDQANFVCVGYTVSYRIQSGAFQVFAEDGTLVYDSGQGLMSTDAALRCTASNNGGGILR